MRSVDLSLCPSSSSSAEADQGWLGPSSRAAKKEAKASARREREAEDARAVAELSMYTATDNPFNDANLGTQFKWVKKAEKEKKAGMSMEDSARRDALRREEAKVCLSALHLNSVCVS